jgi:hypothetical protein
MGLSVDFLAPSAASAELLDWLLDGKAAKGIGDAPVGAGGAALAASFLATAPSLPTATKLPSSGMVSLAALFGDVGELVEQGCGAREGRVSEGERAHTRCERATRTPARSLTTPTFQPTLPLSPRHHRPAGHVLLL